MVEQRETPPIFTPEENEEIGKRVVEVANAGEEAIYSIIYARHQLTLINISILKEKLYGEETLKVVKALRQDTFLMGEVIRRARVILQMERRDSASELEYKRKELGLDPEE